MKCLYIVSLLMLGGPAYSQASDRVMQANVVASQVERQCDVHGGSVPTLCKFRLHISAIIENRRYEMVDLNTRQDKQTEQELLKLGLYTVHLVKDEHSSAYRSYRVFELEYPGGVTEQFTVSAESLQ